MSLIISPILLEAQVKLYESLFNFMGTRGSFPGGKAARSWSWPLTSI